MRLSLILAAALALGGCATTRREGDARGYRRAVQEEYWIIQNQQRQPPATAPANP